jgi:hypothetical protein
MARGNKREIRDDEREVRGDKQEATRAGSTPALGTTERVS